MFEALDITEADLAGLARVAAIDLRMAELCAARAEAAETPEEVALYARAAARATRAYRQDLLMKVRLKRELQRALAEAPEPDPADAPRRPPVSPARFNALGDRAMDLIDAAKKVAWAEYVEAEGLDCEPDHVLADYLGELEGWVARATVKPGFTERPLDDHVAELCRELSLDEALSARWRDLPEPPQAAFEPHPPAPKESIIPKNSVGAVWTYPAGWKPGRGMRVECESFDTRDPPPRPP